jgi:imidazolonepropionase-like amidohydrolase
VFQGAQADALRFGVTTEVDMFSLGGPEGLRAFRAQRESLARTDSADTWSAGQGVTPPGGHPEPLAKSMGMSIPTLAPSADVEAFVADRVREGSDHLKVFQDEGRTGKLAAFPPDRLKAIVAAGKATGRRVVIHVADQEAALQAAEAGGDALAHLFEDAPASDRFVALAKARGLVVIPTLSVLMTVAGGEEAAALAADADVKPWLSGMQTGMLAQRMKSAEPEVRGRVLESVRRLHAAGVPLLAGTDAPNPGTAHGPSLHQELALFVRGGVPPVEALKAATSRPADFFRLGDRGRVRVGSRADLLLVDGDPTRDITATRRISRIWKNGYEVDRTPLPDRRPPGG